MDTPQIDDFLMMAAGIVGALAVITGGLMGVYRFFTSAINRRLDSIEKQLHRNGGTSLRDAVDRIWEQQNSMVSDMREMRERIDDHLAWHLDHTEGRARRRHDD